MNDHSDEDIQRHQKQEAYSHELSTSEDFYVSELEAIVTHIVNPLSANAIRCGLKEDEVNYVFGIFNHMFQFHLQILRIIRDELSVVPTFYKYSGFIKMYKDWLLKYDNVLNIVSLWANSMEFREFMILRLQSDKVKEIIDSRLCSIPWYLYRPFERIKQYFRFFKDLSLITIEKDDDYLKLKKCFNEIKPLYELIKKYDIKFIKKTRLLEIQLQIFGNPAPIVTNDRYFVYNRICQIKLSGIGKKYKHIHLYIFNDCLLWVSKRGHWKKQFDFIKLC